MSKQELTKEGHLAAAGQAVTARRKHARKKKLAKNSTYDAETKAVVVTAAEVTNPLQVANVTGLSQSTVRSWVRNANPPPQLKKVVGTNDGEPDFDPDENDPEPEGNVYYADKENYQRNLDAARQRSASYGSATEVKSAFSSDDIDEIGGLAELTIHVPIAKLPGLSKLLVAFFREDGA